METIVSGVIVLCMFYQGGIIEHTYIQDQKMSSCLKTKRTVERSVNPENVRMACGEVDAILEDGSRKAEGIASKKMMKIHDIVGF